MGIPVSPEEFLDLSSRSIHPESQQPILPEFLAHAVHRYCSLTPAQLNEIRVNVLKSLLQRAQELKLQEHELHLGLEPHARDVLKGKRLLLLKEMLTSMNFGDCNLVSDIMQGFRITGWLPDTKLRPTKVVIPTLTAEDLWSARTENNQRMWSLCRSSGNPELDHALWLQTLKECKAGWATLNIGLCNPPNNYVLSRRFAVQQQDKVRPIDDFSISQVNNTLGSVEKIVVMPSSSTVSLSLALQRGLHAKSPGTQSTSQVELAGKTFDLQSAYKQLPIHKEDLRFAQATVWNPDTQRPSVLSLKALPFGATGSVQGFCRCSLALWCLVLHFVIVIVPSTVFFDDYTSIVSQQDTASAEAAFVLLMRVLGWKISVDKGKPFCSLFHSLGVAFLLPRSPTDPAQVTNTEQRRKEVAATCLEFLRTGCVSPHQCSVFAGRLRWLEGQTFGRLGRRFFRVLLQAGEPPSDFRKRRMTAQVRQAIEWVLHNVPKAPPKCFHQPSGRSFQLFTDGSFEGGRGCMGGVLCRADGSPWQWWSLQVPSGIVEHWARDGVEHPIMQCELLAAAVSLTVWGPTLASSFLTLWIDNDAARHALIAAHAFPDSNRLIVGSCLRCETDHSLRLWIARVPSISNPADAPSRGEVPKFLQGASEVQVDVGIVWRLSAGLPTTSNK